MSPDEVVLFLTKRRCDARVVALELNWQKQQSYCENAFTIAQKTDANSTKLAEATREHPSGTLPS